MTTQTLSEAGQKLADALVKADVLVEHEGEYESQMMVGPADLNTAAALLFTAPEGEGVGLREAAEEGFNEGIRHTSGGSLCMDRGHGRALEDFLERAYPLARPAPEGHAASLDAISAKYERRYASVPEAARRFASDTWGEAWSHAEMGALLDFAALASPQPAVQGPVAAGVSPWQEDLNLSDQARALINSDRRFLSLLYDLDLLPEQLASQDEKTPGLIKAYHRLYGVLYAFQTLAALTPTDPKTPDAGVGVRDALKEITEAADDLLNTLPGHWHDDATIRLTDAANDARTTLKAAEQEDLYEPPAPVGEDETGVREAHSKRAVEAAMSSCEADGHKCSCRKFGWQFDADAHQCTARLSAAFAALAPQPPKAETPAGVGESLRDIAVDAVEILPLVAETLEGFRGEEDEVLDDLIDRFRAALSTAPAARPGDGVDYPHLPLRILEPSDRHEPAGSITVCDAANNDIAEFFHSDQATVGQTYEQALALAHALVLAAAPAADGGRA